MIQKVIYQCYGGAHSSVVAAAIHTGLLPRERIPSGSELLKIPFFDKTRKEERGRLLFFDTISNHIQVYAMGMGGGREVLTEALYSSFAREGVPKETVLFVNTLSKVNWKTRIGGFLSRGLGIIFFGRPLVLWGIRSSYTGFIELVEKVEAKINSRDLDEDK